MSWSRSVPRFECLLAAIGIYGVAASNVRQRSREIGIRCALGARPADVVGIILAQGMLTIAAGAIPGTGAAALLWGLMRNLLFGVSPSDLSTFSTVLCLALVVGFFSLCLPARSALRLDPAGILKEE